MVAITGGSLAVIVSLAMRPIVAGWVTLGLAVVVVLGSLTAFAMPDQGTGARLIEVLLVLAGVWTIVASRAFDSPLTLRWLCFASGALLWALGALGLFAHEALVQGRLRRLEQDERHRREMTRRASPVPGPGRTLV